MDYNSAKWWLEKAEKDDFQNIYRNNGSVQDMIWKAKLTVGLHESELKEVND